MKSQLLINQHDLDNFGIQQTCLMAFYLLNIAYPFVKLPIISGINNPGSVFNLRHISLQLFAHCNFVMSGSF